MEMNNEAATVKEVARYTGWPTGRVEENIYFGFLKIASRHMYENVLDGVDAQHSGVEGALVFVDSVDSHLESWGHVREEKFADALRRYRTEQEDSTNG